MTFVTIGLPALSAMLNERFQKPVKNLQSIAQREMGGPFDRSGWRRQFLDLRSLRN